MGTRVFGQVVAWLLCTRSTHIQPDIRATTATEYAYQMVFPITELHVMSRTTGADMRLLFALVMVQTLH